MRSLVGQCAFRVIHAAPVALGLRYPPDMHPMLSNSVDLCVFRATHVGLAVGELTDPTWECLDQTFMDPKGRGDSDTAGFL